MAMRESNGSEFNQRSLFLPQVLLEERRRSTHVTIVNDRVRVHHMRHARQGHHFKVSSGSNQRVREPERVSVVNIVVRGPMHEQQRPLQL